MSLTHRSLRPADVVSLDQELEDLQSAVARARQNRWHGGDVIEPEFETVLAVLTQPSIPVAQTWAGRTNAWREVIEPG